jgi:hypothetical protein
VSSQGESYEQWRERTAAPQRQERPADTRLWDVAVIVLLVVFFVWVGGTRGWIGLGLAAVLAAEQVIQVRVARPGAATASTNRLLYLRGGTLLVTLLLSAWLVSVAGGLAVPLPLLLMLLDVKDDRSFLRSVFDRLVSSRRQRR